MTTQPSSAPLALPHRATDRVFNMADPLVDRHVREGRGDRPAVRLRDRQLSYRELQEQCNRVGNALAAAGVQPEQRVAILLPDGLEFIASFIGAMKIGAVPLPVNTGAPLHDLEHYLKNSRARAAISIAEVLAPLQESGALFSASLRPEAIFATGADQRDWTRSYEQAVAGASSSLHMFPTGVDEPCYWLYSSGTTGLPKGTVHLHGDMLACVAPYAEEIVAISPDDVTFSVAKLFFSYGLVNSLFLPLLAGASVALSPERPEPGHILAFTSEQKPTLFFSVPTSYAGVCALLEREPERRSSFASVRLAVSAGEPLPGPLYERWKRLTGIELLDGLGSTEVGYIFCSNRVGQVRPGSSGRAIGEHQLRTVDAEGQDATEDEGGELWVKAESTALHYWNQRERTKAAFVGEWIRTGDRYRRDADDYYWYIGRAGDVFKVSGQWVSPLEIESCLLEHSSVLEAAVIGQADEQGLIKPRAFVVRVQGSADVTARELQDYVKSRLLPHKYPRWVEFVDALPKTASGKVQRYKLRDQGAAPG